MSIVQAEARRHFGCPSLEGVELETQGGSGSALQHWEKRVLGVSGEIRLHVYGGGGGGGSWMWEGYMSANGVCMKCVCEGACWWEEQWGRGVGGEEVGYGKPKRKEGMYMAVGT